MSINHPEFPDSCPKCTAQVSISDSSGRNWYACGSAGTFQSVTCAAREPLANALNEARTRIKQLEEALSLFIVDCDNLHHSKKHQHGFHDLCPVVDLILDAKEAKP